MWVENILPRARERLAVVAVSGLVRHAAELMAKPHTDLVVVCDDGVMVGIVTKTDILTQLTRSWNGSCLDLAVEAVMTREVASCRASDSLLALWLTMNERDIQRVPVVDLSSSPLGVVYGRDALQALLQEAQVEDGLLRDYIMGIGYR
jgi:CBS domain-containing protein